MMDMMDESIVATLAGIYAGVTIGTALVSLVNAIFKYFFR